jgi:hypothetical protein
VQSRRGDVVKGSTGRSFTLGDAALRVTVEHCGGAESIDRFFQVDHRLAPPGALHGQIYSVNSTGRFPDQTDDIKRQIMAALADSQCNGSIYLVGGSAGGCLALRQTRQTLEAVS